MSHSESYNLPVEGIPFFTPKHPISPGTPVDPTTDNVPTLFTPLPIRGATLKNRIIVAPMCQYSCAESGPDIGALTPYHVMTLGTYALKGAGLVFIEAAGVQPNGRISPNCPGVWSDAQIPGMKAVADIVHSQGALVGLQLAHAGRKSSAVAAFLGKGRAGTDVGGWPNDVVGPSGGEEFVWDGKASSDPTGKFYAPRELTLEEIQRLVQDWASAARRAVSAGVDVLEIHGAHGYGIHQFLSPITNRRTDTYGGSFENRIRILIEIIQAVRAVIPATMPLFLRLSSTEWLEHTDLAKQFGTWDVASTIRLAKIVADMGVDLLDVSSGGNHPQQSFGPMENKDYQVNIAAQIRRELKLARKELLIGAVGFITQAEQAKDIVSQAQQLAAGDATLKAEAQAAEKLVEVGEGKEPLADVILVARQFMREPEWVLRVAWQLGVDVAWPSQSLMVRFPRL